MKVKFTVLYNNGKTRKYKTAFTSLKECRKIKSHYISFFEEAFKENISGELHICNSIIKITDISSVKIKIGLF